MLKDWQASLQEDKKIILRHDVDTQLDVATKMAEIEYKAGIRATYFIRLHSHSYNLMCIKDYRKIRDILDLGHEIGLHYETDFYNIIDPKKSNKSWIEFEANIIENVIANKIKTICPHEPTRTKTFHIDGLSYIQAYDPEIFLNYKYISDSSCRWRDGTFRENINKGVDNLYVLTHPYWWYNLSPIENY